MRRHQWLNVLVRGCIKCHTCMQYHTNAAIPLSAGEVAHEEWYNELELPTA